MTDTTPALNEARLTHIRERVEAYRLAPNAPTATNRAIEDMRWLVQTVDDLRSRVADRDTWWRERIEATWEAAAELADTQIVLWSEVPGLHPEAKEPHPAAIAAAGARRTLVVLRSRMSEAFALAAEARTQGGCDHGYPPANLDGTCPACGKPRVTPATIARTQGGAL